MSERGKSKGGGLAGRWTILHLSCTWSSGFSGCGLETFPASNFEKVIIAWTYLCDSFTNTHDEMPPRLALRPKHFASDNLLSTTSSTAIPAFLLPFLHTTLQISSQRRHASILTSLSDRPGAYSKKIRRGRGPASGKGGKSGRGSDGQKQHGKVPEGFNGGQTPEHIVHGKYGFVNQLVANDHPRSKHD